MSDSNTRDFSRALPLLVLLAALALAAGLIVTGCVPAPDPDAASGEADGRYDRMVELLSAGQVAIGVFSGDHTPEQGAIMGADPEPDFVFYSLESGPFDIPALRAYMDAMETAAGVEGPAPVALRVPPIRDGAEAARDHVRQGLEAGVAAIVFPHVTTRAEAELAVDAMGTNTWPNRPDGEHLAILIVEDREGIATLEEITTTPGVGVVFAGPGDLRRSYEGDMEAVEEAIQAVLAACRKAVVPCGVTAGSEDIAERIEQGFRVIIATDSAAVGIGQRAAGR